MIDKVCVALCPCAASEIHLKVPGFVCLACESGGKFLLQILTF